LEFAVRIVHFDEKRRIHKQAALPIIEWFDVGCRQAWGGWPWAGRAGACAASSDSHARLCSGESAICGMPRVKVDAMRGEYFRFGAKYNNAIFWSNPNTWMNQDDAGPFRPVTSSSSST
jgi:hypothetical protein